MNALSSKIQLPADWKWTKLGEVCQTTSGGTPSRRELKYYDGKIPWVKSGELDRGIITDTEEKISEEAIKNSSAKVFPKGTLLIALYGATIGKLAFLGVNAATNQAICGIYKNENIDSHFLYNYLFYKKQKLVNQGIGGAQPNISQTILKNLDIPLPPKPTQQAIVFKIEELFSELDKGIENLHTAQQQLKTYRQSVLKWAFEGKLTHENVKEGELPKGWKWVKMSNLIEKPKYGTSKKCEYEIKGVGVLRIPNIVKGIVDSEDLKFAKFDNQEIETYSLKDGDILTIRSNGSVDIVGKCALITKKDEGFLYAGYLIRLRPLQSLILPKYLLNILSSINLRNQIEGKAKSTSGVNNINSEELAGLNISLPPNIEEQHDIVQAIESRLSVADKMEESITQSLHQAEALRQSILKKAFEGRLV